MATKKTQSEIAAESLNKLFDVYPLELSDPKEVTAAMREALARMFADNNLRIFLENTVRYANKGLIKAGTMEQHIFYQSRMETLMQLLTMGKQHFIQFEMIRTKRESLREVEKEIAEVKL